MNLSGARVMFVFGNLELGGAERQGLMLARYLKAGCGADVLVVGLEEKPGRLSALCEQAGIPWQGLQVNWQWGHRRIPANLRELKRVAALLRGEKPDVLMPYTFFPNLVCGLLWRFVGAGLCIWNQRDEGFFLERELWRVLAARLTPYFIANSDNGREALMRAFSVPPDRIRVIRNGIAPEKPRSCRRAWREKLGLSDDTFAACMVANLHRYKDHATLLRAWRTLTDRLPGHLPAAVLFLAGRSDDGAPVLELAASLALEDRVRFLGPVEDVSGLLGAVDLCVHSSRSEGLPNAVLEAMASGLAVVATDIAGIREAVGPAGSPFLAPAGDAGAMADRIGVLLADPALRSEVGASLRERVAQRFDPDLSCSLAADFIAGRLA